ncbi:MAG: MerR family transcriptional regulator [Gemmatimonadales bacterium]|nr:MerR family transcriptional regulator [Gemmatimonadales bacterium]
MTIDQPHHEPRHPIRVVAFRTGLSPDLLRVWERRYGVVQPGRSEGGQRLYSDADIERLDLLHRATRGGRSISRVADQTNEELSTLIEADDLARQAADASNSRPNGVSAQAFLDAAVEELNRLNPAKLHLVLRQAALSLGAAALIDGVITPLLRQIGDQWHAGTLSPAHEHAASVVIRQVLTWTIEAYQPPGTAPRFMAATLAGERHEFGAMLAAQTAAAAGWHVTYLGADIPASDIAAAAQTTKADVVGLSSVFPVEPRRILEESLVVVKGLRGKARVLVGGAGTSAVARDFERAGITLINDLAELREFFRMYQDGDTK